MSRSRLVFYVILGIVGLLLAVQAALAASDARSAAGQVLTVTPTADPGDGWHIAGTVQAMNGQFWSVQGFVIRVDPTTRIRGDLPTIGSYVEATGTVSSDGTWIATEIRVGHAQLPATTTSTVMPTSTPAPSPIPAASVASPPVTPTPDEARAVAVDSDRPGAARPSRRDSHPDVADRKAPPHPADHGDRGRHKGQD